MSDPYRKLFLDHVKSIIKKDADKESLGELLRAASPDLTEEALMTPASRGAAFRTLRSRIHPDNHVSERDTAAMLHRDSKDFYPRCCANLTTTPAAKRRKTSAGASPTGVNEFPQDFSVEDKWPFLDDVPPKIFTVTEVKLPALIAARCINARGAIAHERKTEISYLMDNLYSETEGNAVVDIFRRKGGGAKVLDTMDEIKKELMNRGPVISTSFIPTKELVSASEHGGSFLKKLVGKTHELLIVGWKFTATGEVWLAQSFRGGPTIQVASGQFGVDDVIMAPESSFENEYWQKGPYVSLGCITVPQWMHSCQGMVMLMSAGELQSLATALGEGFVSAAERNSRIVVFEKNEKAHSRKGRLKEVSWDSSQNKWKVHVTFTDRLEKTRTQSAEAKIIYLRLQ